ncbi:MAG TPA: CBS domain-containing protein [Flavobacteriales bacterium]|nr:CBS domain-containing protein [Flavobacteriales bacterium]HIO68518.1 CBS domain-containing protein [Flavobacteriales bacterium]
MLAIDLITDTIPPLKISDTGSKALLWMDEFKVRQLPIVKNLEYVGLISEADVLDLNQPDEPLEKHKLSLTLPYVTKYQHMFDVIKVMSSLDLSLLPVLDEDRYLGIIPLQHLFRCFSKMSAIEENGGLIILELNINDYSLAEIGQIVESNDSKVLSSYVTSHADSTKLELTIKINKTNIANIIQTFNRYGYTVKASYQDSDYSDDMKERLDYLMNYLKI